MNFAPTEEQLALQRGIRELCAGRLPLERIRASEPTGVLDRDIWADLADAGVFALLAADGLNLGLVEAVLVFEELGRALAPGPLVATVLAAARHVDGAADGARVVGSLDRSDSPLVLEHPGAIDAVVVAGDRLTLVEAAALEVTAAASPLDPLTPVGEVTRVADGEPIGPGEDVDRWRLEGATLTAALLVGLAEEVGERATTYAREREQFGRPIGSFQAVKHLLAEMLVSTEVARAAVHAAAVHLDDPDLGDIERIVGGAKLLASKAGVANGKTAVQVHGGIGFTWEHPIHLYLKRAVVLASSFGSPTWGAETVAAAL